ncbi:MAG: hypothetical protein WC668_00480 [Patescibacteria group bacterium]|jgi:hypothetical protein
MIFFLRRHWFLATVCIILLALIGGIIASYSLDFSRRHLEWGVTFSSVYAQTELGLDWQKTYLAILDDLKVDNIRLSAYWNQVETVRGRYDFKDLDWQINEASKRQIKIVLAVGRRLPRWPECHDPIWLKDLKAIDAEEVQLKFVQAVVGRYKDNQQIKYFQVENEPFLSTFGICPPPNKPLLKEEIAQVKKLTAKPILVTDSGELSTWWPISHVGGEVLGSTLYRVVYNPQIGYFRWFTPPAFYWARVQLIKWFTPIQKVIVAELQAESWHKPNVNLAQMSLADHNLSMSLQQLKENISFTRRAGFDEAYLWGAEWWYYMKTEKDYHGYWDETKKLWAQ